MSLDTYDNEIDDNEVYDDEDNEEDEGYELDLTPVQDELPSTLKKQCKDKKDVFVVAEGVEEFNSYEAATNFMKSNRMKYA